MVTQSYCGMKQKNCNSSLTNPVPFMVIGEELKGKQLKEDGRLSDIAPTILDI